MFLNNIGGGKYGLIIPSKKPSKEPVKIASKESAFAEESEDEEDKNFKQPNFDVKMETLKANLRKSTKINIEKALEEDASVFQYDEVYDRITREKDQKYLEKGNSSAKKPKYVNRLLEVSAVRKLEKELLNERKAQRELEAEKEKYAGKESFVTGAYKAKMAELRELVERRREEEAKEEIMDITKQDGLGGFYRFMFQQKTGSQPNSTLKSQDTAFDKDVGGEQMSSSRSPSPKPQRYYNEADKSGRPSSSRYRSPSPLRGKHRHESNYKIERSRHQPSNSHALSPSSHSRYRHHRGDPRDKEGKEHRLEGRSRQHSSSTEKRVSKRRHDAGGPKRREKQKDYQKKGSLKVDELEKKVEITPPPPGFIRAKPRQITDEEIREARKRYLDRKAAGLNKPAIVHSDDEC